MSKHTPGPWHYSGDSLTHRQFDIYAPNRSPWQHICTVNNLSVEKLWQRDAEEAEANARLIAAAPELLEAAKHMVSRWNSPAWKSYEPTGVSINLLRAAIAKAEGKEEQP